MAIGLGRMFGILLPINFFSPFRSPNIAKFFRRWHITLSSFIRNYLFYPATLTFTRISISMRFNKLLTFLISFSIPMIYAWSIAGFWHGPAWTYLITGVADHIYTVLSINICETAGNAETFNLLIDDGGSGSDTYIYHTQALGSKETFVHNDKFVMEASDHLSIITASTSNIDVCVSYLLQTL